MKILFLIFFSCIANSIFFGQLSQVCFSSAVNYPVGTSPYGVISNDFNGDGKKDLATANQVGSVSILLGSGTGTFASSVNYSAGTNAVSLVSADFNGDLIADLAVANYGSNNILILIGSGTGTFASAVSYTVGSNPFSVVSNDFNSDGKLDLAVANFNSNNVSILFGSGTGTFSTAVNYSVGTNPCSICSADFNLDGNADLAVSNDGSNNMSVLLGSATGTFALATTYNAGTQSRYIISADFNLDGKVDLAVANTGSNNVSVFLGSGTGTFAAAVNYSTATNPVSICAADFNGDGKTDIAAANLGSNNVSILIGSGTGTFNNGVNYSVGASPESVYSADFDSNGKPDLVIANNGSNNVSILLNTTFSLITSASSPSVCQGNTLVLTVSGSSTYTWNPGGATTASVIVSPVVTTNYTVTSAVLGCTNTAMINITVSALPIISVIPTTTAVCSGSSANLVANGANSYTFNPGALSGATVNVSPLSTTVFTVTGTSTIGCINTVTTSVVVNSTPTIAVNSGSICSTNSFTIIPSGANTYTITGNNFTVAPLTTTNYSITGTSTAGCVSSNTAVSTVTVFVTPTVAVNSGSICSGQTLILTASGANTYSWNAVANSFTLSVNPNSTSSYSLTGTSAAGCISSNTAVSNVTVEITPTVSVNSGSICSGNSFTLIPNGSSTYTFSSGSTTVNPLTTTSYSVIGTSTAGCISSNTAISTVTVIALPTLSINSTNTFVCQGLIATLTASGANTYSWNTGSGNAALSVTPALTTTYSVLGTALNGCTNTAVQSVSVNALTNISGAITATTGNVNGIVILYKKSSSSGQWDSITNVSINSSAYNFTAIPSASYAVLAVPSQTDLLETYGSNSTSWQGASLISHSCITNSTENINIVPILNIGTGPGSMSGRITEGAGFGNKSSEITAGNPIGGISVKGGKNPGGNVVGRVYTNANGEYSLTGLPANTAGESYFILVDIPGLDTNNTYHRIILVGSENYTNLDFVVDSVKINPVDLTVGVKELFFENGKLLVYPNPSNGNLNIAFTLIKSAEISVNLFGLSGRLIKTILSPSKQDKGDISLRAQLSDVKPGIYFVKIKVGTEERLTKLVVME